MPISQHMNRGAAKPDLSSVMARTPVGLTDTVKASFQYIWSPDSTIGLLGFEFVQFGCRYQVRYKDDQGNDKYTFQVTAPNGYPYAFKRSDVGIAEKAHALMIVLKMMDPHIMQQNLKHFDRLEKACFDAGSGTLKHGYAGALPSAQNAKIVTHYAIGFPDDVDYKREPHMQVMAMEWIGGARHKLIDNTRIVSEFITSSLASRSIGRKYMPHVEAVKAIDYAKLFAERSDATLFAIANQTGLWRKLDHALLYVSHDELAAPHP